MTAVVPVDHTFRASDDAESASSSSSSSSSSTTRHGDIEEDTLLAKTMSSSMTNQRRRASHFLRHVVVIAMSVFLSVTLLAAMLQHRPPLSHTFTADNTFSTLTANVQARLAMPALEAKAQRDLTMTDARCRKEFPLLYPQLTELQSYWSGKGGITRERVEENDAGASKLWGHSRLIIRDGQLFIRTFKEGKETRNSAMVHLIMRAVQAWPSGQDVPPIDMVLSPGDRDIFPQDGGWGVTRNINDARAVGRWLVPDFGFVGWPEAGIASFGEFRTQAAEVERAYPWSRKATRAFWRGFPNVYAIRRDLLQRTDAAIDATRTRWADVRTTIFGEIHEGDGNAPLVPLPQHCQHRYLIHVEGNSYSGRSRYLLSCHAVTVAHPLEWTQHFHPALNANSTSADQNFVQLPGPMFDGLEETIKMLRLTDGLADNSTSKQLLDAKPALRTTIGRNTARQIADNVARTMRDRYLTPAATMCYTRAALQHYSGAMNASTWGAGGPALDLGSGITPGSSKGRPMHNLHGDIEVGVWRLLGSPDWPPL